MAFERDEERRLIRLAAAGDREASAAFIREYQPSLRAYLLRLSGRPEMAEDIAQAAFVRVLTNLPRFVDRYRFSPWLFTIAKRLYVNARQKHAPLFNTEAVAYERSNASGPGVKAAATEVSAHVRDALQHGLMTLGEEQREIVVLFHQLEWPIALIAEHMGMPEGTIKSHLHRSRKKLRAVLAEHARHGSRVREAWSDTASSPRRVARAEEIGARCPTAIPICSGTASRTSESAAMTGLSSRWICSSLRIAAIRGWRPPRTPSSRMCCGVLVLSAGLSRGASGR